jgi:hypothetical protein
MTTRELSLVAAIAQRLRLIRGRADTGHADTGHADTGQPTSTPVAAPEHQPVVLSRHRTSQGVVTYARCSCGDLQIWLTGAGQPTSALVKASGGPERCRAVQAPTLTKPVTRMTTRESGTSRVKATA